jgi:dTDP-glucose 4,6-dehydratase
MAKVLVTRADEFIGSHLVEELARTGARAFVLYNSSDKWGWLDNSSEDVRKSIKVIAGDTRDTNAVRTAMRVVNR